MNSIYIVSSERSGSNLLRMILGAHSSVFAPSPPHLYKTFSKYLPFYGNIHESENFEHLVEDVMQIAKIRAGWEFEFGKGELMEKVEENRTLSALIHAAYTLYTMENKEDLFVSKENDLFNFVHQIDGSTKDPLFIYLYRDGRDVACSENRYPAKKKHIFLHAEKWRKEQLTSLMAFQDLPEENYVFVSYENLLERPSIHARIICDKAGIEFEEGMLDFHRSKNAKEESQKLALLSNISKPIMKGNSKKYLNELSRKEVRIFEAKAHDVLKLLGYELEFPEPKKISDLEEFYYRGLNKLTKYIKKSPEQIDQKSRSMYSRIQQVFRRRTENIDEFEMAKVA